MHSSHTKMNTIPYKCFGLQEYLASDKFGTEEKYTLCNLRANSVDGFKMYTPSIYRNKLGCLEDDSLENSMICRVIDYHIDKTSARYQNFLRNLNNSCKLPPFF